MDNNPKPDPNRLSSDFSCARLSDRMVAPGEDPREFKQLYDQLHSEWQPHTITEWIYFKRILSSQWSFKRLDRMETTLYATIGRMVWERQILLRPDESLDADLRSITKSLRQLEKMREMKLKSLASGIRELAGYQKDLDRMRKARAAETRSQSARKLADLEPGSNLIQ